MVADGLNCRAGDKDVEGFVRGSAEFLLDMDVDVIRRHMFPADSKEELSTGRQLVLCALLQERKTGDALKLAGELLIRGVEQAGSTIFFIGNFSEHDLSSAWSSYSPVHVQKLIARTMNGDEWSMRALQILCNARVDLAELVVRAAEEQSGITRAVFLYAASKEYGQSAFSGLEKLAEIGSDGGFQKHLAMLHHMEYDWSGNEDLFVRLLRLRDVPVAKALLGGAYPPIIDGLGKLDIGHVDWWLDWMLQEEMESKDWQFLESLGGLFGSYLDRNKQTEFVAEFNRPESRFRGTLMRRVLPHLREFTVDAFSEEAVAYILEDFNSGRMTNSWRGHVIGQLATEEFISARLLPQLKTTDGPRLQELRRILRIAGTRFGVRFFA